MKGYTYVLRCADDTLYCGWTNDLAARLDAHNSGKGAKYTRGRGPLELVYSEACGTRGDALRREAEALEYVFGYTILNDVSARTIQNQHKQWYRGKSLDGFTPILKGQEALCFNPHSRGWEPVPNP